MLALLQGCTLETRRSPDPAPAGADNSRLENERREQAQLHLARALEHELQQDFINAAGERVSCHAYLDRDADLAANTAKIWDNLNRADKGELRRRYRADPGALAGWLELAFIKRTMLIDLDALGRALSSWQENYPAHPANAAIIGQVRAHGLLYNKRPERVALLLPLRGALREAAQAVRDGFVSAWYHSGANRSPVRIYEANSLNIDQAYSQAVADGADFIVGPLEKQALTKLSARAGLSVPVLALNHVRPAPDMTARARRRASCPPLMQFSLAPEDEAPRQVAERARADGLRQGAGLLFPAMTGAGACSTHSGPAGSPRAGLCWKQQITIPRSNDYGPPVKQLLNIDGSELRTRQLRQSLGRRLENRDAPAPWTRT